MFGLTASTLLLVAGFLIGVYALAKVYQHLVDNWAPWLVAPVVGVLVAAVAYALKIDRSLEIGAAVTMIVWSAYEAYRKDKAGSLTGRYQFLYGSVAILGVLYLLSSVLTYVVIAVVAIFVILGILAIIGWIKDNWDEIKRRAGEIWNRFFGWVDTPTERILLAGLVFGIVLAIVLIVLALGGFFSPEVTVNNGTPAMVSEDAGDDSADTVGAEDEVAEDIEAVEAGNAEVVDTEAAEAELTKFELIAQMDPNTGITRGREFEQQGFTDESYAALKKDLDALFNGNAQQRTFEFQRRMFSFESMAFDYVIDHSETYSTKQLKACHGEWREVQEFEDCLNEFLETVGAEDVGFLPWAASPEAEGFRNYVVSTYLPDTQIRQDIQFILDYLAGRAGSENTVVSGMPNYIGDSDTATEEPEAMPEGMCIGC